MHLKLTTFFSIADIFSILNKNIKKFGYKYAKAKCCTWSYF